MRIQHGSSSERRSCVVVLTRHQVVASPPPAPASSASSGRWRRRSARGPRPRRLHVVVQRRAPTRALGADVGRPRQPPPVGRGHERRRRGRGARVRRRQRGQRDRPRRRGVERIVDAQRSSSRSRGRPAKGRDRNRWWPAAGGSPAAGATGGRRGNAGPRGSSCGGDGGPPGERYLVSRRLRTVRRIPDLRCRRPDPADRA